MLNSNLIAKKKVNSEKKTVNSESLFCVYIYIYTPLSTHTHTEGEQVFRPPGPNVFFLFRVACPFDGTLWGRTKWPGWFICCPCVEIFDLTYLELPNPQNLFGCKRLDIFRHRHYFPVKVLVGFDKVPVEYKLRTGFQDKYPRFPVTNKSF
jgi:hypothetical protein